MQFFVHEQDNSCYRQWKIVEAHQGNLHAVAQQAYLHWCFQLVIIIMWVTVVVDCYVKNENYVSTIFKIGHGGFNWDWACKKNVTSLGIFIYNAPKQQKKPQENTQWLLYKHAHPKSNDRLTKQSHVEQNWPTIHKCTNHARAYFLRVWAQ